jgi:hypothetical protein
MITKKRAKKFVVACVDTETTMMNKTPKLIGHFGAIIGDLGNSCNSDWFEMDYYVKEIVENPKYWLGRESDKRRELRDSEGRECGENHLWLDSRYTQLLSDCFENPFKVKSWDWIISEFNRNLRNLGVDAITAYNLQFDLGVEGRKGAIRKTSDQLSDLAYYLPRGIDYFCLMDWCVGKLVTRNWFSYIKKLSTDERKQFQTEKGNYSYSAECMLRFQSLEPFYSEQHTALRDARMEMQLCKHMFAKYGDSLSQFINNVHTFSWVDMRDEKTSKKKMIERVAKRSVKAKTKSDKGQESFGF